MAQAAIDYWIVFTGDHIRKLRESRGFNQAGFGTLLNVTAPTICRWERGCAPPATAAIPLLVILLCAAGIVRPQPEPPSWWKPKGQRKRRTIRKLLGAKGRSRPTRIRPTSPNELFQLARLVPPLLPSLVPQLRHKRPRRVFHLAVSPNGVREARLLGDGILTAMASFHQALGSKEIQKSLSHIEAGPSGQGLL